MSPPDPVMPGNLGVPLSLASNMPRFARIPLATSTLGASTLAASPVATSPVPASPLAASPLAAGPRAASSIHSANPLATDTHEERVTVLVVEDHALLAQTLVIALTVEGCPALVAELYDAATLLRQVRTHRPDVVLLDLDLGGALGDGLDLVQPLTQLGARVLVVSGTTDRLRLAETVERGAVGFLSKTVPFEDLLATVLDVVAQRVVLSTARRYELMADLRSDRAARRSNFQKRL